MAAQAGAEQCCGAGPYAERESRRTNVTRGTSGGTQEHSARGCRCRGHEQREDDPPEDHRSRHDLRHQLVPLLPVPDFRAAEARRPVRGVGRGEAPGSREVGRIRQRRQPHRSDRPLLRRHARHEPGRRRGRAQARRADQEVGRSHKPRVASPQGLSFNSAGAIKYKIRKGQLINRPSCPAAVPFC